MKFEYVDEKNFILYAANHYESPICEDGEFEEDILRFKYLRKLFTIYEQNNDLRERLILNHIIVLYNVFGDSATKLLFYKLENYLSYLKPFLLHINRLPTIVDSISESKKVYYTKMIPTDKNVLQALQNSDVALCR